MKPAEAVPRFLSSIGHNSEAEFYLSLFRSEVKESFAAISVDASIIEQALDAVVMDLRFLNALDLAPIVLLGLQQTEEVREKCELTRTELIHAGVPAVVLSSVAEISEIARIARSGSIPIVPLEKQDETKRFFDLGEMLKALGTRKLIFLQRNMGLRKNGKLISVVNLSREFDELIGSNQLTPSEEVLIKRSHQLIFELVPHKMMIAITSPLNLLHELFTVKGAGTLLRKGVKIRSYSGYQGLDKARLKSLLVDSFGRPPVENFFSRPISRAYVEENYRGVALVVDSSLGAYLTKFSVTREAQGEGIGHDLWQCVFEEYDTVIWRARSDNPIDSWYERQCDGFVRVQDWTVYFRGLATELIPQAIRFALRQPRDF